MSKYPQSGLKSYTRDYSAPDDQAPRSSQPFDWDPTPPQKQQQRRQQQSSRTKASSGGSEARLQAIRDALAGYSSPTPTPTSTPLVPTTVQNKRASPSMESDDVPQQKRRRQYPPDWKADVLSKPSLQSKLVVTAKTNSGGFNDKSSPASSSGSTGKAKSGPIFLSREQTKILQLVQDGDSLFYTGSAGTGKSVLLREIIKTLRKKFAKTPDAVAITASTGIAACNIGGVTIHSFSGIGLGIEPAEELVKKIKKNKKAASRWLRTKVLIIDEVSMVDGDLFDKLAKIASILLKSHEPFGGIQVIVTGDFFQLPPVTKGNQQVKFAFEAQTWKQTVKHTYNLTKVFRQSDQTFVDMLNEMRFGTLSAKSITKFRSLSREIECNDGLGPTELFPMRDSVERSNQTRMTQLNTQQERFEAVDGGSLQDVNQREKMLANFMAPKLLFLRIDAQVMLIKNMDDQLVNGSMGRVMRFVDPATYGTEKDLELMTGDKGVLGSSSTTSAPAGAPGSSKKAATIANKLYPVVEFILPNGHKRRLLVMPESWKVELPSGEVQLSRTQLPLILAWAMSIHKSQGQTLDRVKVDLGKVFEKGQAYVALSRATSLEGLQVLNFDPAKVLAHPKVVVWSKTLQTIPDTS